ncbi:MAG: hypothetical protein V1932_05380, partial [Chloroflexota bacterium]
TIIKLQRIHFLQTRSTGDLYLSIEHGFLTLACYFRLASKEAFLTREPFLFRFYFCPGEGEKIAIS